MKSERILRGTLWVVSGACVVYRHTNRHSQRTCQCKRYMGPGFIPRASPKKGYSNSQNMPKERNRYDPASFLDRSEVSWTCPGDLILGAYACGSPAHHNLSKWSYGAVIWTKDPEIHEKSQYTPPVPERS
ncbi:hypothetical protein L1887_23485 [Cichorium endivia]|nr:hypothetical protein L1887_23485 [Cichorium endivia]